LVWVMALFGKGAPLLTPSRRPFETPQGERGKRRNSRASGRTDRKVALHAQDLVPYATLRDGAKNLRLLRASGQRPVPWTPLDDGKEEDQDEEKDSTE
jgi:hypothetical protein